jgi:hypothetical protein
MYTAYLIQESKTAEKARISAERVREECGNPPALLFSVRDFIMGS